MKHISKAILKVLKNLDLKYQNKGGKFDREVAKNEKNDKCIIEDKNTARKSKKVPLNANSIKSMVESNSKLIFKKMVEKMEK